MFLKRSHFHRAACCAIGLGLWGAALAQTTGTQIDPYKVYSTIGLARGETLRLGVVNIGGTDGYPPDPCNVLMGFADIAGAMVKSNTATIQPGEAAFLTLNFSEGAAFLNSTSAPNRLNFRPVVNTVQPVANLLAPPCRTVSTAEVFDAFFGRTHVFAVPAEGPSAMPPPDPDFGIVGVTALDTLRLNITNITGSNTLPPDPCNVQMGFVDAAGAMVKTVNATIDPGHSAALLINYREAASVISPLALPQRFNLRPLVAVPPDPCHVVGSAELIDSTTGITVTYLLPAVQSNLPAVQSNTLGQ